MAARTIDVILTEINTFISANSTFASSTFHTMAELQEDRNGNVWPMSRINNRQGKAISPQDTDEMQFYHRLIDQTVEPDDYYRGTSNYQTVSWQMQLVGVGFRRKLAISLPINNNIDYCSDVQEILAKNGRLAGKERVMVISADANKESVLGEEYPGNDKILKLKLELFAFSIQYTILQRTIGNSCD